MIIHNYQELRQKKDKIKEVLSLQEKQMREDTFFKLFSGLFFSKGRNTPAKYSTLSNTISPYIEPMVNLGFTALYSQLFRKKSLNSFSKMALGMSFMIAGHLVSKKLDHLIKSKL